ncbi:CLUMA_CG012826, isoform A [Clunio marinus]|uniref:CLUMA_CG012826, isoform A n=1 Tax=Clunio marinus TaxID=568069 RepID=A0A1J1IH11_9DIPT|nr:CLUMA_CG012826, isoform A [Clunio marinus]
MANMAMDKGSMGNKASRDLNMVDTLLGMVMDMGWEGNFDHTFFLKRFLMKQNKTDPSQSRSKFRMIVKN